MERICSRTSHPLYDIAATRLIEQRAAADLLPGTLMQRAGLSVARLALALVPHARCIWIACGPGNNGGDGFEAALQLHQRGKAVVVTWTGSLSAKSELPPDAQASRQRALAVGVPMAHAPPPDFDLCIDALLGIGAVPDSGRPGGALMQDWLAVMQRSTAVRLSIDVPTGLNADTGSTSLHDMNKSIASNPSATGGKSIFTLSLLTLKPGLFTASGRDSAGQVWFDDLGLFRESHTGLGLAAEPCAWLMGAERSRRTLGASAAHASHKGSFGDVAVIGGESTGSTHMAGAALLAATAALHAGAGRVFVALLGDAPALSIDPVQPEFMFRAPEDLDLANQVIVCGCGGGQSVRAVLPDVLSMADQLVLDADALNAVASDPQLQDRLGARHSRGQSTVLTPHPLEAARLIGSTTARVQADRLTTARRLIERFQCVVVLKGSGTIVAAPGQKISINPTGNALLATAGTGDVLAGLVGALLARGDSAWDAARHAAFEHGQRADGWSLSHPGQTLTASRLARCRSG